MNKLSLSTQNRFAKGFTLIELMISLVLLTILITLAVPSFQQTIASTRLTGATNDFYASLLQARSDAIRQGQRVTVCPSSNSTSCSTGTWSLGWIAFVDTTRGTTPSVDSGESVSSAMQAVDPSIVIQGNGGAGYFSFGPDGQSKTINGAFQNGTVRVCSTSQSLSNDARARDIVITRLGRVTIEKPTGISSACPAPS